MRRLGIRAKTALLSVLLLLVPYVGYQYVREMESFLRLGLERAVLDAAGALAGALHERDDLMPRTVARAEAGDLYVHPLQHPRQIDGYLDDWTEQIAHLEPLPGTAAARTRIVAGRHGEHLYVLLRVTDESLDYAGAGATSIIGSDHLRIMTGGAGKRLRTYFLATPSPGWMQAYEALSAGPGTGGVRPAPLVESRIRAELRASSVGYDVEIRMPMSLLGPRFGIEVHDADGPEPGAAPASPAPGRLVMPSQLLEDLIRGLHRTPGRRVRIIDGAARVIARGGRLRRDDSGVPSHALLRWLLGTPRASRFEDPAGVARLDGAEVRAALTGGAAARWREIPGSGIFVVSAAHPIWSQREVIGAVVVEETTQAIQSVRYRALVELIGRTVVVFGVGTLVLLLFATRITRRLLRLRDDAEGAIDEHGRVIGTIRGSDDGDEIGQLARSFSGLTDRLRGYNHYLEQLARRLSHELRTPVAVVRSSLESIEMQGPGPVDERYLHRAREGVRRLDTIISRMSEASRLEEALLAVEPEPFDLAAICRGAAEAYAATWPQAELAAVVDLDPCPLVGSPDLIAQMLDKLVSNAMEFSTPGQPVRIELRARDGRAELSVANAGPSLPDVPGAQLFESMVSIRSAPDGQPHLGLGLYIVRLIVRYHGATVVARNTEQPSGVRVSVSFPLGVDPRSSGAGSR